MKAVLRRRSRAGTLARAVLCILFLTVSPLARPEAASAHAQFDTSDPAPNSVLQTPPPRITLHFTEPLEDAYSRVELYDETGAKVQGVVNQFDAQNRQTMTLPLPAALANGTYSAVWRTLSAADGHRAQGYVAFTIGTAAHTRPVLPPAAADSAGPSLLLRTLSRWIPLLGLALSLAVWPVWLLVLRPAISPAWQAGPALTRRVRRLAAIGLLTTALGSVVALGVQASGTVEGAGLVRSMATTVTDTRYGRLWLLRMALLLVYAMLLLLAAWWRPRRHPATTSATLLAAFALPLPFSLISHAAAQTTGRGTAVASDMAHLIGASLWVGGLFLFVGALLPTLRALTPAGRRVVLSEAIPRFSAVALGAWTILAVTGLYSAWLHVGNLAGLRDTAYGHSLIVKLLLLSPVLALAAVNLLLVGPRIKAASNADAARWARRFGVLVAAEAVIVVAVLFTVGRLTAQPPARDEITLAANQITLGLDLQGHPATLTLAPGVVGPNHYRLDVAGDPLPAGAEAVIRLTAPSVDTSQKEIALSRSLGNVFEWHGAELSFAGDWKMQVIVRKIGGFQWTAQTSLPVTATNATALPRRAWHFGPAGIAGLLLLVAGVAGLALAWRAGRSTLRRESAGLGAVMLALAAVLLVRARVDPVGAISLDTQNPIPFESASIARGKSAFLANCTTCHGVGGHGDGPLAQMTSPPAADFTTAHARADADAEFFNWIKNGKPPTAMAAFGKKLTDSQIWDVINYLREIQRETSGMPTASPIASPAASPAAMDHHPSPPAPGT